MAQPTTTHLDTQLQHAGTAPFDPVQGAAPVALPSMRTSTVRFQNLDALDKAQADKAKGERSVTYGRVGMDTHAALEEVFCKLEGGERAFLASSGLGAITLALFSVLNSGDHVIVADCAYGPVRYLDKTVLGRMNIQVSYSRAAVADLADQLRPNTRVLYVESPGSLLFEMLDMPALAKFAREHNLILVTDNTWGSGYVYRPLDLGADISVVAGTKYVGGHSDLMLGAVVAKDPGLIRQLNDTHYAMGYSISADDAWLAIRGVRTLPLRMRQTAEHAMEICRFLASRAEVARIYHPAWPDDPGHAIWQRDCTGSNGMLSVELKLDNAAARRFVDSLTLFGIGFSWGGFESLVQLVDHASLRSHGYWPANDHAIVRLHIGLESPQDLIADMTQALEQAAGA
ncbi:aminotransferase class I/II-fold pyridoxal phosphate-dependent enzyme [Pusillimonas sp. MFBS29]|uniref:trans-sulfuration enzyme family protein n=1 Tax=Pusillimonas sp. MFBS29 TaxID=2886690 RepID=UPI001D101810|nr:aminotransferase class I/II-fold pyridoxal phosphate-dependent enzyme [Pusillimonas sp. MFBS29]MCC2596293.1 aminotransferase class I/II-fold pyridoxal phosphate-dependent enzyme [Pusillimonas sp. MFBS29]